jgi:hypothetical protein
MLTPAFRILHDRDSPCLLCLVCNRISYNPNDIRERYCGGCHLFLTDVPMDLAQPNTEGFRPGLLLEGAALKDEDFPPLDLGIPEGEDAGKEDDQ